MKTLFAALTLAALLQSPAQTNSPVSPLAPAPTEPSVETLVCFRHGEKPHGGLGQLTARGLNRSLALPDVLLPRYGTPQFIFAPNPTDKVDDRKYFYVRPIATIEPTAIRCKMPVNTQYGCSEIKSLESELLAEKYQKATVFVVWEHGYMVQFAKNLVAHHGGDPKDVPRWPENDYDTIWIMKITHTPQGDTLDFKVDQEGLNDLSDEFPEPASKK
jgi:hypothetical protein